MTTSPQPHNDHAKRPTDPAALARWVRRLALLTGWEHPFFLHIMGHVRIYIRDSVPTACVYENGDIQINQEYASQLSNAQFFGVLAHELMHLVVLTHKRQGNREAMRWNYACFPADTLLPGGVPIEKVATEVNPYVGPMYTIKTQVGEVPATIEHPFFVRKRIGKVSRHPIRLADPTWVLAREIRVGDFVCIPKLGTHALLLRSDTEIDLSAHIKQGQDSKGRKTFGNRVVSRTLPLTPDTAWMLGLYVAEGSGVHVQFSLGTHETKIIKRLCQIITDLGYKPGIKPGPRPTSTTVGFGSPVIARWLAEHCGRGAHNKHIPDVIMRHEDAQIRRAFLAGLVEGDGWSRKRGLQKKKWSKIGTVSKALMHDVVLLVAQEGVGSSIGISKHGPRWIGDSWTNKTTTLYQIDFSLDGGAVSTRKMNGRTVKTQHARYKTDEHGVWIPVKRVTTKPYDGMVYNMSTPDHTYIAHSLLVHNSDRAINHALREAGIQLPEAVLYPLTVEHQGWSAEQIYEVEPDPPVIEIGIMIGPDGKPTITVGGGCGVLPIPDFDVDENGDVVVKKPPSGGQWDQLWREVAVQASSLVKGAGKRSSDLLARLLEFPEPQVRWDTVLRGELAKANLAHGHDDVTRLKKSRRSGISGPQFPGWTAYRPAVVVVIDSSGSMSDKDLEQTVSETHAISNAARVDLYLIVHDVDVQFSGWIRPGTPLPQLAAHIKGRGGTCFKAAYNLIGEMPTRFDALVHLTDGGCFGTWPEKPDNVTKLVVALLGFKDKNAVPDYATVVDVEL